MMQKKQPRGRLDIKIVSRRAKQAVRKKHRKTVSLSEIHKVWREYVRFKVIEELVKYGKVNVDKHLTLEIVGRKITDDKVLSGIFSKGIGMRQGMFTESANLHKGRPGYVYTVVAEDKNFKGKLIFKPAKNISSAVHAALVNTNKHYRIQGVNQ